jgi:putative oxidoreductase
MKNRTFVARAERAYSFLVTVAEKFQSPLLLALRLYWGWQFFVGGKGKLLNLDRTVEFFGSLGLPFPLFNAVLASTTECIGGLLLLVGLAARLASIPLAITMVVAYLTAERESLAAIFSDTDKFTSAPPFLFLLTALIIFAFGPGAFSIDWLIARKLRQRSSVGQS